ncbi:hypothetical protein [Flavobacterium daemonense]|uniref:hypothetical protein n=1 Tax=Flavobacterium daemonense TaxID=1393049 RepID=UPI001186C4CE|nr:hypothetical protein [Flavobacterium daemonense]KAF2332511.1 hypothetical protein FND99_12015 [Flavobacterium daemonense]
MNILATWICIDSKDNASYFPSSKGMSSDAKIQSIYWKCIACSMYTARYFNPELRLIVFSNTDILPTINGINYTELFKKLNIEFHNAPFDFQTPKGYYKDWRNQFYEFSIFEFISNSSFFNDNDKFCLIDSDCIITRSLNNMFDELNSKEFIHYKLDYPESHLINGISRNDMKYIFENIENMTINKTPDYYAGEFFATNIFGVKKVCTEFNSLWPKLISFHLKNELVLNEEAHVLSYIYFKLKEENNIANNYIKRIWTDPTTYRNVNYNDQYFAIWHLPAEKRHGFKKLFNYLSQNSFSVSKNDSMQFVDKLKLIFTIPKLSLKLKAYYVMKKQLKEITKRANV